MNALLPEFEKTPSQLAAMRLPRKGFDALLDAPPEQCAKIQERWTLRQMILDARTFVRDALRARRKISSDRRGRAA